MLLLFVIVFELSIFLHPQGVTIATADYLVVCALQFVSVYTTDIKLCCDGTYF